MFEFEFIWNFFWIFKYLKRVSNIWNSEFLETKTWKWKLTSKSLFLHFYNNELSIFFMKFTCYSLHLYSGRASCQLSKVWYLALFFIIKFPALLNNHITCWGKLAKDIAMAAESFKYLKIVWKKKFQLSNELLEIRWQLYIDNVKSFQGDKN